MRYKISNILDEEGNLKNVPKGFSAIELESKKVMLINTEKKINILLVRVYKDIYATRILQGDKVQYKFLKYEDEVVTRKGENYLIKALNEIIRKVEERFDIEKSKDILYALYLLRGCIKGDKNSCGELQEYIEFETIE